MPHQNIHFDSKGNPSWFGLLHQGFNAKVNGAHYSKHLITKALVCNNDFFLAEDTTHHGPFVCSCFLFYYVTFFHLGNSILVRSGIS